MIVTLDCSTYLAIALDDESSSYADSIEALLRREGVDVVVPSHWICEVSNALLMAHRRGRLSMAGLQDLHGRMIGIGARLDAARIEIASKNVLPLALKHRLTIYDAFYLELAIREQAPLATLDRQLRTAALAEGVFLSTPA